MLSARSKCVVWMLAASHPGYVAIAQAQGNAAPISDEATAAKGSIEDIIVTARRREEALSTIPVAVVAVTGEALAERGISNLQQLGNLVPNLTITSTIFIDSIFLRGIGSSPNDPGFEQQTGLFVDGVYYGNGRWVSSAYVDAESVQVMPGPQGVYFGKNTIAGAVQITTNNPGDKLEGHVKAGYEIEARERYGEVVVSGPLSDTLGARLALRGSDMDGWVKNVVTGGRAPGSRDMVGRLTLAWKPSDAFDANLKIQLQKYEDEGPTARTALVNCAGPNNTPSPLTLAGIPFFGLTSGTAPCRRDFEVAAPATLRRGPSYSEIPAYAIALNMHWTTDDGVLTSTTGLNRYKFESNASVSLSSLNLTEVVTRARNRAFSTELRYQTTFDGPLNFLAGGYYQSTDFHNFQAATLFPPEFQGAIDTFSQQSSTRGETLSGFGEVVWSLPGNLEFDAGVRYTRDRKNSDFQTLSVAPFPLVPVFAGFFPRLDVSAKQTFTNWSPQATLTWRPTSDFMAYIAYKTGFLSGGFGHAQVPGPTTTVDDLIYGPEKTKGGEIGTKFFLADRRVQFNVAAYYYKFNGLQVSTFKADSIAFAIENAGRSVAKGIEVNGLWKAGAGLTLSGNVAYGKSYYTRYIGQCLATATFATGCDVPLPGGGFAQDFKGASTSFAPLWSGRVAVDYRTDIGPDATLSTGVGLNFSDDYIVGDILPQPGWVKLDGRVSVEKGPWMVSLIGANLTNEAICNQGAARPFGGQGELGCWLDRSREVRIEAALKF